MRVDETRIAGIRLAEVGGIHLGLASRAKNGCEIKLTTCQEFGVRWRYFFKAFLSEGTVVYENHQESESERLKKAVLQGHTQPAGF